MNNKEKYKSLCHNEKSIPIFSQPWWLNIVCGEENWGVALVEKGDRILGSLPYYKQKKRWIKLLSMPSLTQTLGPWLAPSTAKYAKKLSQQKDVMSGLIDFLPDHHHFSQKFHHSITNWLPFYWKGFSQNTRYTYIIKDLTDIESMWSDTLPKVKTDVKKAMKVLSVKNNLCVKEFYRVVSLTYKRQGRKAPFSFDFFKRLYTACEKNGCGKMFFAVDSEHKVHAVIFIIWDTNSAYYLVGGGDPELRSSGATSLCLWEAIKFASTVTKSFDFEGSMVEPIERFFRGFGAQQVPYFSVRKSNSRVLSVIRFLQGN